MGGFLSRRIYSDIQRINMGAIIMDKIFVSILTDL
jgi:hypothetical protein